MDLCTQFLRELPVSGASISVFDPVGRQSSVCSSDRIAYRIDELQFEFGEGPQWKVVRTGEVVIVNNVISDPHEEWPVFGAAVKVLDVGALFTFPLMVTRRCLGAVSLYRTTPGALSEADVSKAGHLASAVAFDAVAQAMTLALGEDAELSAMPEMRREVHQATGMILVQLDTTSEIAFLRLQALAFAHGRAILDVARDVVARKLNFRDLTD